MSDTPMDERTLTALKGSIAKWERIVNNKATDHGSADCPLCKEFLDVCCIGCPIKNATGVSGCKNTPYPQYCEAEESADEKEMDVHAKAELDFLISLLPKEPVTP